MPRPKTGKDIACLICGEVFYCSGHLLKNGRRFCSWACGRISASKKMRQPKYRKWLIESAKKMGEGNRRGKLVKCPECGKEKWKPPSKFKEPRCSKACANAFISRAYKGQKDRLDNLVRARTYRDFSTNAAHDRAVKNGGKASPRYGAANNLWRGGIASFQNSERQKPAYKAWRRAVYERDGFRCVECGAGKNLHAHHVKSFAANPVKRYDVKNGRTLCQLCHSKTHGRYIPNIGAVNKRA